MIYSNLLLKYPEVFHGFTGKKEGDCRPTALKQKGVIIGNLLDLENLVLAEQVHGDKISQVKELSGDKIIMGVDGLLTSRRGISLGIHTADCLPILFWEPAVKIIGAIHAGWKGTLLGISQKMIKEIENIGGKVENTVAAIGPHIGMCCYDVDEERALLFEKKFGKDQQIISNFNDGFHLDLAYVNFLQLVEMGLKRENLDVPPSCTFCNSGEFFSFRRSKQKGDEYGEMLAIIGLKN